jgi:hypothetical protein
MRDGFGRSGFAGLPLGALALVVFGCGGGGVSPGTDGAAGDGGAGGSFCESFTACGGNVVGTWHVDRACAPPTRIAGAQICGGEIYDLTKVVSELAWTFRADGTASLALMTTGPATSAFPAPCNQGGGVMVACADLGATYERVTFVGGKAKAGACHETGGTCTCPLTFTAAPVTSDGTYSTSGTTLQFMLAGASGTLQYCATATTLKLQGELVGSSDLAVAVYARQ